MTTRNTDLDLMPLLKLNNPKTSYYLSILLVLTIITIVLFFGLRPKTWSNSNNVHWLPDKKALSFHNPGIAYVDNVHIFADKQLKNEWTIQILVSSENLRSLGFRSMVMLHNGEDRQQLALWQWGDTVIAMNGDDYEYSRKWPRISAMGALKLGQPVLITVTSTQRGTCLFINGTLAKEVKDWQATVPHSGKKMQLILGNSVYGKHSWEGEIYGLAFYGKALTQQRVQRDYDIWLRQKVFAPESKDNLLLLDIFNKKQNRLAADRTTSTQQLQLPVRQVVLKKTYLSPPWHNFTLSRSFLVDAVLNFIGFIPLGAAIYYWLQQTSLAPGKYQALVSVALCFSLSLGMEIVQAWLPNRFSSLSDLTLNTLGAWLGVMLLVPYRLFSCFSARK